MLATGRTLDLGGPENTWKLSTSMVRTSDVSIVGTGATVDVSAVAADGDGYTRAIRVAGSAGAKLTLTANAVKLERAVTATPTGLVAGDYVQIGSDANYPAGGTNPIADRGEIKRIRDIAGSTVTFEEELYDDYATADNAFVRKLTMPRVRISGVRFLSDTDAATAGEERAVDLYLVNDFDIKGCTFEGFNARCVSLMSSIRGKVHNNDFAGSWAAGSEGANTFYGVAVYDSCQWVKVYGNHAERLRRLAVNGSHTQGQDYYGAPRFINIFGNDAKHIYTEMFEHHGHGEQIIFSGNQCDTCDGLARIEGPGVTVEDNDVSGYDGHAVVFSDLVDARDITIRGNRFHRRSAAGAANRAIYADLSAATAPESILIEDNKIYRYDVIGTPAIEVVGTTAAIGSAVEGNRVYCTGTRTTYAVSVAVPGFTIGGNRIRGSRYGIKGTGADQDIDGNEIVCTSAEAAGYAIEVTAADQRVTRNRIRNTNVAFRLAATATNPTFSQNAARVPFSTRMFSDAGATGVRAFDNVWELDAGQQLTIASAATLTLPFGNHKWVVSGTTGITSITAQADRTVIQLLFTGILTVTDGSNLVLAGNLTTANGTTLTLVSNGANWHECGRSVN